MGAANRWTSTGGYGWIRVGTPFENGVADVSGCSQIGVVPFYGSGPASKWQLQTNAVGLGAPVPMAK
jgi:hypothetical protein